MTARTNSQRQRARAKPKLRVSQIVVNLVLLNEHDAPIPADQPIIFTGDANGTAAENLAGWLAKLPAHLEVASAQLVAQPEPVATNLDEGGAKT